jgi:hypothetical protein
MCGASMPALGSSSEPGAVAGRQSRSATASFLPVPDGTSHPLTEELLKYDVDVSWWVTPDAYERGYYTKLHAALRHGIERAFPFTKAYYSNTEIPELPG